MAEERFEFRKRLVTSNVPFDIENRDKSKDEISLKRGVVFNYKDSIVVKHAVDDFLDYLKVCFNIKDEKNPVKINIKISKENLEDVCSYKGRIIEIKENEININAYDERGAAQAIYDIEDMITHNKAPYIKKEKYKNKPLFSPRMAHSAYDLDVFPDGYMLNLAKDGIDALLLFVKDVNTASCINMDFNNFIDRALSYGLDTYIYCDTSTFMNPDDEGAEEEYYNTYGKLFRYHPKFKGIVFVGESCEFHTKDKRTTQRKYTEFKDENNFVDSKPAPGWWPCEDFPRWLERVKGVIRKEKPDADIVFWTYNWGWAPKKERLELLNSIPTDISLLVTFEMFENLPTNYGITERVCDYSVAFAGPGKYFISEAEVAKKRNIRLYAMSNTGGRTWDFGVMPYEPFPQQWITRFNNIVDCKNKYNLSGLMECHHYGYTPSFITKIAKNIFNYNSRDSEEVFKDVIDEFSMGQTEDVIKAFDYWSQAIRIYMPTDDEQYCAMRVGPAYPLILGLYVKPPKMTNEILRFESSITEEYHSQSGRSSAEGKFTLHSIRMPVEIRILNDAIKLIKEGLKIFKGLKHKNKELKKIINLGEYMICCFTTDINVKKMYKLKTRILIASSKKEVKNIIESIKKLGANEIKNSEKALKCVDYDSSIGYEPSMGYGGDRAHIEWKIKQVNHMLDTELTVYERGLEY